MTGFGHVNLSGNVTLNVNPASGSGAFVVQKLGNTLATDVGATETIILEGNIANTDAVLTSVGPRVNNGTIRLQATTNSGTNTAKLNVTTSQLTNNGTIEALPNPDPNVPVDTTLPREINASLVNNGNLNVAFETIYAGSANLIQNSGTTTLAANLDVTGSVNDTFDIEGGTLRGSGSVIGHLLNQNGGTVAPGTSPGVLHVSGNYTQDSLSTLSIEIGGLNAASDSDRLTVSGSATLDGTLALSRLNSFSPALSFAYDYMTYLVQSGAFDVVTGTNAGSGKTFVSTLNTTSATLTVTGGSITRQPDGKIALGAVTNPFAGDGVYNLDGTNQSKSKSVKAGKTVTFFIRIQNDGAGAKDRFKVQATGSNVTGLLFKCFRGTTDVTTAVNNGTFLTAKLAVGAQATLKCTVKVNSSAGHGSSLTRLVIATSNNDSAAKDAVKLTAGRT
jgi:hypothetical protein